VSTLLKFAFLHSGPGLPYMHFVFISEWLAALSAVEVSWAAV